MSDVIIIDALKIDTVIGVYDWERAIKQRLIINARLYCDISRSLLVDDLDLTLNYKQICDDIKMVCDNTQAKLLEYLAGQIFLYLFTNYPCHKIELSIIKPHAIMNAKVGVSFIKNRQDFIND